MYTYIPSDVLLVAQNTIVYIQSSGQIFDVLVKHLFVRCSSTPPIKYISLFKNVLKKTKNMAYALKIFSNTAFSACSLKFIISTEAAWWNSAFAWSSEGIRGVPCPAYLVAM